VGGWGTSLSIAGSVACVPHAVAAGGGMRSRSRGVLVSSDTKREKKGKASGTEVAHSPCTLPHGAGGEGTGGGGAQENVGEWQRMRACWLQSVKIATVAPAAAVLPTGCYSVDALQGTNHVDKTCAPGVASHYTTTVQHPSCSQDPLANHAILLSAHGASALHKCHAITTRLIRKRTRPTTLDAHSYFLPTLAGLTLPSQ